MSTHIKHIKVFNWQFKLYRRFELLSLLRCERHKPSIYTLASFSLSPLCKECFPSKRQMKVYVHIYNRFAIRSELEHAMNYVSTIFWNVNWVSRLEFKVTISKVVVLPRILFRRILIFLWIRCQFILEFFVHLVYALLYVVVEFG